MCPPLRCYLLVLFHHRGNLCHPNTTFLLDWCIEPPAFLWHVLVIIYKLLWLFVSIYSFGYCSSQKSGHICLFFINIFHFLVWGLYNDGKFGNLSRHTGSSVHTCIHPLFLLILVYVFTFNIYIYLTFLCIFIKKYISRCLEIYMTHITHHIQIFLYTFSCIILWPQKSHCLDLNKQIRF